MVDVLFINATQEVALNQDANGTMLLATKLLQAGFSADILRFGQIEQRYQEYKVFLTATIERILGMEPKVVSFYTLWPHYHIMLRIAKELKARRNDLVIVLGGPQASATAFDTMNAAPWVDYICTGEGENTIVPFIESILNHNCQDIQSVLGLYYRKDGVVVHNDMNIPLCDLDTLPHWDDRLCAIYHENPNPGWDSPYYFMPIDAGRGCPYNCTFCCSSHFWKRTYRLKSPARILEDIRYYYEKYGITSFWFSHDAITTNRKLITEVCDLLIASGMNIRWRCTSRIDCVDEELLLKMKESGLVEIELGIETGSLRMQKLTKKNLNLQHAQKLISFMLKQGLLVGLFFMYGFPEETEEDLNDTLELIFNLLDSGVNHVSMSFTRFNPATDITNRFLDKLELDPDMKILIRGVSYGFEDELDMIRNNKAMFPFFYHLNTPVRNNYQYAHFFIRLYRQYTHTIRHLRKLYKGDNLRFYRDFYNNNLEYFQQDMIHASNGIRNHGMQMLANTVKDFDVPYLHRILSLLQFEDNANRIKNSECDITIQEVYDFNYIDYKMNLPIEMYSDGKTEILLQKKDGKVSLKVLQIT
jgi:radical SAM superfamily enzyme YgiQ (UPF0313 family)